MELIEFVTKLAEQHKSLLKVIELQNTSIQALNQRVNAMASANMIVFAMLLEAGHVDRELVLRHLDLMLENDTVADDPHLESHLRELLSICRVEAAPATGEKKMPSWFRGVVQGGLAGEPRRQKQSD